VYDQTNKIAEKENKPDGLHAKGWSMVTIQNAQAGERNGKRSNLVRLQ
jgi:hypothetical protein